MINVEVRDSGKYGKAVFAIINIAKDEVIAEWDGQEYEAEKATDLPEIAKDHAIQFEEHRWQDSKSIARYIAHSCEPNAGFKGALTMVAMRDIKAGEEITWDYDMSEDSDWRMDCKCGSKHCRKVIGSFKNMPEATRKKYGKYLSSWIRKKYNLD